MQTKTNNERRIISTSTPVSRNKEGYYLIHRFEIDNFRCFKKLRLEKLKRFNFIVGESGTGKTALLEALFLAGGSNPQLWFRIRQWRGLGEVGMLALGTRASYESIFRDMFYNFDQKNGSRIKLQDSSHGKRELEVFYQHADEYVLPLKGYEGNPFHVDPITFRWDINGAITNSMVEIRNNEIKMANNAPVYPVILISSTVSTGSESAHFYSVLSRMKKETPVLKAIQSIFPEVEAISLEILAGGPALHVSIKGLNEKLPIGDLSGGINKYIHIVLSILTIPTGAILIDEIENGFYYKNLPILLKSIIELCDEYDVQLFATTHSYEFLQSMSSAIPAAQKADTEFSLLRMENKGKQISVRQIPGVSYEAAMKENSEVR